MFCASVVAVLVDKEVTLVPAVAAAEVVLEICQMCHYQLVVILSLSVAVVLVDLTVELLLEILLVEILV
jgi:hypothetical protein|tara:strand:+ start:195 stop:401 length:207 start_codon:yes stop_codon:yes gene_type:complete